jgi:PPK2 family polyphosphate:nucleotide phosphotransferase
MKHVHEKIRAAIERYRIVNGASFRLADHDPADTGAYGLRGKEDAEDGMRECTEMLRDLQAKLYAQDRRALLLVFQAIDAAGKDGTIRRVMSGVNPQGVEVTSFKAPSSEELDHDFLWRVAKRCPERGRIGIFNRSHYEETLVVRVHPELLAKQRLPAEQVSSAIWTERFEDICGFERHLSRSGTVVRKFFLHVSKEEQRLRFLERLENPEKHWKFSAADVRERAHWDEYMSAYEDAIRSTATESAPWFVVPADHKWFTRLVVLQAIVEALLDLELAYPEIDADELAGLEEARRSLLAEKDD